MAIGTYNRTIDDEDVMNMAKSVISMYERIIEEYLLTESVKQTAENLGTTPITVRRVLITEGLWHSQTSDAIGELFAAGVPTEQIAEQLSISLKNVQAYIPYTRGSYHAAEKSLSSQQSQQYRERKQIALNGQVSTQYNIRPNSHSKGGQGKMTQTKAPTQMLHLRLELDTDDLDYTRRKNLVRHGKVTEGLIRDVIVPDTMTLHALHYLIQKCFGWQNSHLHHFTLPQELFDRITENRFARWGELAGIYFRFPSEELDDLYSDDDYDGTVSFKTWLKRKYVGPYNFNPYSESYLACQAEVKSFYKECPQFQLVPPFDQWRNDKKTPQPVVKTKTATVDDVFRSIMFGSDHRALLERLTLGEILTSQESEVLAVSTDPMHITPITDTLHYFYDYGDGWEVIITPVPGRSFAVNSSTENTEKPSCIHADGLCVLDDVGGIGGYCDFLETIHGSDKGEAQAYRQWARSLGWTGRLVAPDKLI